MIAARPQHRCLQQSQSARASRASGERSVHIGRYPFVDSKSKKLIRPLATEFRKNCRLSLPLTATYAGLFRQQHMQRAGL